MNRSKTLFVLFTALLALMVGCASDNGDNAEIVRVVETVLVTSEPIEVTRLVEVGVPSEEVIEVTRIIEVSADGEPLSALPTSTPLPTLTPTPYPTGQPGEFDQEDLDKLFDVWQLIEENYYGDLPADEVVTEALVAAMVEQLGDQFTNYFPPDVAERINDGFRGDFTGIGAYVDTNDDGFFYIVRPIANTPAFRAGLEPNDIVIKVDGRDIQGLVTDEVVSIVRGPIGEPVTLTVVRDGVAEPFDVTIVRDRIIVPQVEFKTVADGQIGYIRLESFNQVATEQLTEGVQSLLDSGVQNLIFDLRYNGGGLLNQAVSVGDLFLPQGGFLIIRDSDGNVEEIGTNDGQIGEEIPLVLLINENSASASEIIAGAFRDRERATIIGTNSFGKGSVQSPYRLDDSSEFRVTTANFFSPADVAINGVGVAPDIIFDFTPDVIGDENDETIERAVEFILTGE